MAVMSKKSQDFLIPACENLEEHKLTFIKHLLYAKYLVVIVRCTCINLCPTESQEAEGLALLMLESSLFGQ